MPEFHIPESRAKAAQRRKLSKVLAFVKRAQSIRLNTGCTIMPIPTTNKNMIAIAGSVANVSNLIKFMCEIGLISIPPAPHFLVMFSFGFVNNVRC